jgi:di/tricarboxylate transporter
MTAAQVELFLILAGVLGLMLWGRVRHDLVAAGGLFAAVTLGVVDQSVAFSGFSHPAVIIVALVLIASRAFENSGIVNLVTRLLDGRAKSLPAHTMLLGGFAAALSAVINNVAALALLMQVDIQAARNAGRSPRLTLMPLSFATILGGMTTLIGTPPNIIAATFRGKELGAPYQMFDFLPVGLAVAGAGLAFIALFGSRLIPKSGREAAPLARAEEFTVDLDVHEGSSVVGTIRAQLDEMTGGADVVIIGLARDGHSLPGGGRYHRIQAGDVLTVEGASDQVAAVIKRLDLQRHDTEADGSASSTDTEGTAEPAEPAGIVEVVVRSDSRIAGYSARTLQLRSRFGITVLGLCHEGRTFRTQIGDHRIAAGDVLLLASTRPIRTAIFTWLGVLPINEIRMPQARTWSIPIAVGFFAAAIGAAGMGWLSFPIAMAMAVAGYALTGLVPAREFYEQIDWSIIVMLACLLPLGEAFDTVGATRLSVGAILDITQGQGPVTALLLLMGVTMLLSSVLNNVAVMVITGPVALALAERMGVSPDTFLMGAVVATSCAFLTPIGHKNNILIMGPGGYAFGDYWRLGVPLHLVVLAVSVPMLLWVWPL